MLVTTFIRRPWRIFSKLRLVFFKNKHTRAQVKPTGVYRFAVSTLQLLGTSHNVHNNGRNPSFPNNFSNQKKKKVIDYLHKKWHAVAQLVDALRCKPERRGFIEIFQRHNPSGRFMALVSTQPLT